jgi:CHAT domain-containing protein
VKLLVEIGKTQGSPERFRSASAAVFGLVIQPLLPDVGSAARWIIVPDGDLYQVPFPALFNPASKRFVVENFLVVVAPSSTVHIAAEHEKFRPVGSSPPSSVLAVGNPLIDRKSWAALPLLRSSDREATGVGEMYQESRVLVGAAATTERFLAEAPKYQIIHLAAHGLPNAADPSLSLFVLSPGRAGDSGALYAHQIQRLQFRSTRVVVLSACDSLEGEISKTEGPASLAAPFLAAGVPTVIGTLWRLEDQQSKIFAERFHHWILRGEEPVHALRLTQIEMIQSSESEEDTFSWAAFEAFGA